MQTTITEALSELKLIKDKVAKKEKTVLDNLVSVTHMEDPFKEQGGTAAFLKTEMQAIEDLRHRFVTIRSAIAKANENITLTIGDQSKTISQWLVWKREISKEHVLFYQNIYMRTKTAMDNASAKPQAYKDDNGDAQFVKVKANVDQQASLKRAEEITDALQKLDGLLSLKNATTIIEV